MDIIEMVIDSEKDADGVNAISLVESPAIEIDFIALGSEHIALKAIDEEKRILMGAALVPNKPIYRAAKSGQEAHHIFFSSDTVVNAALDFFKWGNQNKSTKEHKTTLSGQTVYESWIVEDPKNDKSLAMGMPQEKGTWMITMKVENDQVWKDVKSGKLKGFSIEGFFARKAELKKDIKRVQKTIKWA